MKIQFNLDDIEEIIKLYILDNFGKKIGVDVIDDISCEWQDGSEPSGVSVWKAGGK